MTKLAIAAALTITLLAGRAHADVPAGYTGTPFGGTPWPVPGRIEMEDFDEGGQTVGWSVDDHTGNFGEGGCAANGYREGIHPQLCQTNTNVGENDVYTVGPNTGQKYPTDAMPQSIYIGYTHAVDWVKITVNVATAGTYKLSSSFASEPGGADGIKIQVSFNDVLKADSTLAGTGGYHNWADYPDFATVELDAGVQVVQFATKSMHVNYDYLQLSLVLPGGGVDDGSGGGSGGSAGTGGGAGSPAGGAAGGGGAPGVAGSTGSGGTEPAPTGGSGGSPAAPGGAPAASAGGPAANPPAPTSSATSGETGGCSLGRRSQTGAFTLLAAAMLLAAARLRRFKR